MESWEAGGGGEDKRPAGNLAIARRGRICVASHGYGRPAAPHEKSVAKFGVESDAGRMNGPASTPSVYTEAEERANCLTHAAGVLLGLVGMAVLVALSARRGDIWDVVAACVFGTSLVLLYTASTLYHAFREPEAKRLLRKFDHAAIFLLIAGTYTPFLLVSLRGTWGWSLFGIIWGLAVAGIVLKFWFAGRFTIVSTLLYLAMGWLVVVATRPMLAAVAPPQLWLLLAGGLCYTGGTVFYLWRSLPYHHAVWHLLVLGGSGCHYFAVYGTLVRSV